MGTGVYCAYVYLTGMWYLFGYYVRYLIPLGFGLAVLASIGPWGELPFVHPLGLDDTAGLLLLVVFGPLAFVARRSVRVPADGVEASFPFKGGRYYVAHGGSSVLVNHHL